jgi:hypothetical protein
MIDEHDLVSVPKLIELLSRTGWGIKGYGCDMSDGVMSKSFPSGVPITECATV